MLGEGGLLDSRLRSEQVSCCLLGPRAHTPSPLQLCWDPRCLVAAYSSVCRDLQSLYSAFIGSNLHDCPWRCVFCSSTLQMPKLQTRRHLTVCIHCAKMVGFQSCDSRPVSCPEGEDGGTGPSPRLAVPAATPHLGAETRAGSGQEPCPGGWLWNPHPGWRGEPGWERGRSEGVEYSSKNYALKVLYD